MRRVRAWRGAGAAVVLLVASLAAGATGACDAGGLLVVEASTTGGVPDAGPVVLGPNVTDLVNGGNVAKNDKFTIVYTLGQPTPNQNVEKSTGNRLNGGLVGAMNGN
jgi:hypothetical protein